MKTELTNCPRCNSAEQKFARQTRQVDRGVWEAYIRCSMCRWEHVLGATTPAIEQCRRQLARIKATARAQQERYGQVQGNTQRMQSRMNTRLVEMVVELQRRTDVAERPDA